MFVDWIRQMATEKQIAANRANAKRSTGPRTVAGKLRSSRNALRHGLSLPMQHDLKSIQIVSALAQSVSAKTEDEASAALAFAFAQSNLLRIGKVRSEMMSDITYCTDVETLHRLSALDRYERYAATKRRRALQGLEKE